MYTVGTAYFVNKSIAISYYGSKEEVNSKLEHGEIYIGKPEMQSNESLVLLDNGVRYGIQTKEP